MIEVQFWEMIGYRPEEIMLCSGLCCKKNKACNIMELSPFSFCASKIKKACNIMELPYHTKAGTIKTASQKIQKKCAMGHLNHFV